MSGLAHQSLLVCKALVSCMAVRTLIVGAEMPALHAESALASLRRPWNKWLPRRYSSLCTMYPACPAARAMRLQISSGPPHFDEWSVLGCGQGGCKTDQSLRNSLSIEV